MEKKITTAALLRQHRAKRGWTLGRLAQQCGVHKATLSRWEAGTQVPRAAELATVLDALGVDGADRQKRLLEYAPASVSAVTRRAGDAALSAGELVHALRLRSGLTQSEAAAKAGVTQSLLSRWENGYALPDDGERHNLCFHLGASAQEAAAMITQPFIEGPLPDDRDALVGQFRFLRGNHPYHDKELEYLVVESRMARLAKRKQADLSDLTPIWAEQALIHADKYKDRNAERRLLARSLKALRATRGPLPSQHVAVVLHYYEEKGGTADPAERLAAMEEWVPRFVDPDAKAYYLNGVVGVAREVDKRHSLCLLDEITEIITGDEIEFPLRMENRAHHLIRMNEPAAALAVLERHTPLADYYDWHAGVWERTRAKAYAALGDRPAAANALALARARLLPRGTAQYSAELDEIARVIGMT